MFLVQVSKDPLSSKCARLTANLTLSSRYLVYLPHSTHIGVSIRIEDESERERLRALVEAEAAEQNIRGGLILRTVAEGAEAEALAADITFLHKLWADFKVACPGAKVPSVIHTDLSLPMRTLRDLARGSLERIRVDSEQRWQQMRRFAESYYPQLTDLIQLYQGERPLLDLYGVEDEINRALDTRVPLKSNGYLVDRKSTRLNSSHVAISYAVVCLKTATRHSALSAAGGP